MAITRGTLQIARRLRRDIGTEVDQVVRDLTGAWIKAWDRLATPWQLAAADLVAEAVRLEHWPRPTDIARLPRVIAALDASEHALQGLAQQTADAAIAGAKRVIDADVEFEARIIASQAPATEQEGLLRHLTGRRPVAEQDQATVRLQVQSRIRTNAVDVMRNRTAGQITADTFPLAPDAAEAMRRELIRGIDVGGSPREAAVRMVANTEGAFNGGLTRAMVISRTEMLDAYRTTSQQIHAANSDIVPAWSWLSALDERCCPSCLAMHGTVHAVTEPGPDDHPQGRCGRLPQLAPWSQLGIRAPEPPSVVPDAEEWFAKLPRAQQLQIMGPGRLQLLESGSVGWGDLSKIRQNSGWRPSRIPTPLRELRQRVDRGLPPTPRVLAPTTRAIPPTRLGTPTLPIPIRPPATFAERSAAARTGDDALASARAALDVRAGAGRVTMSRQQRAALRDYESSFYNAINGQLRRNEVGTLVRRRVDRIDEVMGAARLPDDVLVYRGVTNPQILLGDRLAGDLTGMEWAERAYVSTSTSARVADSFTYGEGLIMNMVVPRGTSAIRISGGDIGGQSELLLERGLGMRVVADHGLVDGVRRIDVEVFRL